MEGDGVGDGGQGDGGGGVGDPSRAPVFDCPTYSMYKAQSQPLNAVRNSQYPSDPNPPGNANLKSLSFQCVHPFVPCE